MTEHAIMDVDEKFMTDSMKEALEKHQFQVYYQPKYDMKTEKVAGAEALVRWMHPEKGMISPRQFIPIFEKNGFITELDSYVWETVCQDMNKWKQQGYPAAAVSVNLSRKDLCNPRLLIILSDLLEKYKIPANYLHLEITENAYTDDYEKMIETVCELRKLGFMIEMDDFGSGSASLNMLAELPIDVLKLDMDFIQTETARASGKGILGFVISLAKWLNLSGVAEGVETPEQLTILQSMGCNFVQGYYYEKPMPEKEFAKILSTSAISEISFSTNQGTIEDILMKRVAEDSLMQEKYRFVLDNLDVAFFEYDETGNFYSSDKYTQYVVSRESISNIMNNDGAYEGVHPDDIPILFEFFKQKERHQKKVAVTLRLKMVDGTYRWTEMMGFFDYDMNGKRIKSMGVLRDVDREWQQQNRKLQDALKVAEKANQAKTDFLSRVSHDMRTPLNGILGITYLISRKVKDESIQQELQQLEQSGKYLLNLVDDTLDVSSIESGKMELHPQVCDGRTAFETVISMVMPSIEAKGIHLKMKAENLPFTKLYIDVGRAQQAVMNILSNAIKFTPDGGTIEFSMENLSQENGLITDRIVIRDNGIGMSEAFMKNLFQPFAQEHNGSKSIYQGTGLGLTIAKQCMELMNGKITIRSQEGKGTEVTMILPMPVATAQQISDWNHAKAAETEENKLQGIRVLLCEDHPLNAAIATQILERKGIVVERAENGKDGLDMFSDSSVGYYQAILMDIRMPIMDGIEATKEIRMLKREDAEKIPIIAMTANVMTEDVNATLDAGMSAHLGKPIDPERLYKILGEYVFTTNTYKGRKVLVVDDIGINRGMVRKAIEDSYQVVEASNGQEALEVLEREVI